jgi:dTDP-glucose 4,6-dehydratase
MKRALLTGAGGFIGAHTLAHVMHNTDWELVCVDSFRHKGKTDRIAEMLVAHPDWRERCTVITHDLIAPFSEQMINRIGHIDYILNIASESHVDRSIEDPVPFVKNNVDLVLNMLEYARLVKPEIFFQISTDEVYGAAPVGSDHKEWSPILPSNPYSGSKAAQEAIAISYWRTYGVPVVITNTMNNFGEMQDPEKYIPMVIQRIYNGQSVTIHGTPDYIGSRFYLHARNHADALLFIANNIKPAMYEDTPGIVKPTRFNVVGNVEADNLELAELIAEMMGKKLKYELVDFHQTRPGHDRRYALDGNKLFNAGWKPPIGFEHSLRNTIEWTLEHPEWLL